MAIKYGKKNLIKKMVDGHQISKVMYNGHQIRPESKPPVLYHIIGDVENGLPVGWSPVDGTPSFNGGMYSPDGSMISVIDNSFPSLAHAKRVEIIYDIWNDGTFEDGPYQSGLGLKGSILVPGLTEGYTNVSAYNVSSILVGQGGASGYSIIPSGDVIVKAIWDISERSGELYYEQNGTENYITGVGGDITSLRQGNAFKVYLAGGFKLRKVDIYIYNEDAEQDHLTADDLNWIENNLCPLSCDYETWDSSQQAIVDSGTLYFDPNAGDVFTVPEYQGMVSRTVRSSSIEDGLIYTITRIVCIDPARNYDVLYVNEPDTLKTRAISFQYGLKSTLYSDFVYPGEITG